jgi:hypothetical protein
MEERVVLMVLTMEIVALVPVGGGGLAPTP